MLLTRKELAEIMKVEPNNLGVYIMRNKLILTDNLINVNDLQNWNFINDLLQKKISQGRLSVSDLPDFLKVKPIEKVKKELEPILQIESEKKNVEVVEQKPKPKKEKKTKKNTIEDDSFSTAENTLALRNKKTALEISILSIKEQKLLGEVVPVELIKTIFSQFAHEIVNQFRNGCEDLITNFAKLKDCSTDEIAQMRLNLNDVINESNNKAVSNTKDNLDKIIEEFSIKKEVGEREV